MFDFEVDWRGKKKIKLFA